MSGFIDPEAPLRRRVEALELLIDEALGTVGLEALSPEARSLLEGIHARNPHARRQVQRLMAEDPIDDGDMGRWDPHAAHLAAQRPTPAPTEES